MIIPDQRGSYKDGYEDALADFHARLSYLTARVPDEGIRFALNELEGMIKEVEG